MLFVINLSGLNCVDCSCIDVVLQFMEKAHEHDEVAFDMHFHRFS